MKSFSSAGTELGPSGSRRKDLFLDLLTSESSLKAGEGRSIENEGQATLCWQGVGFPLNSGLLVNWLARGRETPIFTIGPVSVV